jgi:hypothetical protein
VTRTPKAHNGRKRALLRNGLTRLVSTGTSNRDLNRGQESWLAAVAEAGQELLGTIGRVTVSIPVSGPGEVLLPVRGGTEAFAAWSDEAVPRHSRVVVVECMSARSVFVALLP